MSYRAGFTVAHLPPMNTSATRRHWSVAHREVNRWRGIVNVLLQPKPEAPLGRSRVTVTRMSSREPDHENLTMSFKAAFDALQSLSVIENDGPDYCERVYRWERAPRGKGGCRIEVEEIE